MHLCVLYSGCCGQQAALCCNCPITAQVHMRTFKVMPGRSDVVRSHAEGAVLELFSTRMSAVSLTGYLFFGSSVSVSDRVSY